MASNHRAHAAQQRLRPLLSSLIHQEAQHAVSQHPSHTEMPTEVRETLEALGYLHGENAPSPPRD